MRRTTQICAVAILAFVCIIGWKSYSIASDRQAHSTQAVDQPARQSKMPESLKTKNADSELVGLNLGSLPNPPAPDPPEMTNRTKQEQGNAKAEKSDDTDHQKRN